MIPKKDILKVIKDTKKYLEDLKIAGVKDFDCSDENLERIKSWEHRAKDESLFAISLSIKNCQRCKLSKTRTNIVFGKGSENAGLMLVGEAPGANEDKQGEPFVGRAGLLLTKILKAINLERDEIYIGNIIKCRPPNNRNPENDEIKACYPFLERQIKTIKPKVICTLGSFASQTLLKTKTPISKLRGKFYDYNGIKLMPTYHPAYLLRDPNKKRDVWEDVQLIQKELKAL